MLKMSMMSLAMGSASPREIVAIAAECGMQAVDWITLHNTRPEELKKLCDDAGLAVAAHTPLNTGLIEGRNDGMEEFKRSLEAACILNAPVIMVPPFAFQDQRSMADDRRRWAEFYAKALPLTAACGKMLCIESTGFVNSPVTTGKELLELVTAVPGLKIAFDNGNTATACDMTEAYETVKDFVVHFHLKNWKISDTPTAHSDRKRCGKYFTDCILGEGDLDLKRFYREHVAPNYHGCFNLETSDPTGKHTPREVMKLASDFVKSF